MTIPPLPERLARVRASIADATTRAGRPLDAVRLVAVSKRHPASAIEEAYAAGQRDFGENYSQELVAKAAALGHLEELRLHHIGALQRNKLNALVPVVHLLHGVDRPKLIDALGRRCEARTSPLDVLLQVNLSGETSKSGCAEADVASLVGALRSAPGVRCVGLMTMPAPSDDPEDARPAFRRLATLAQEEGLTELSMGMSADFEVAIEEGATLVRVGTAIFGPRPQPA